MKENHASKLTQKLENLETWNKSIIYERTKEYGWNAYLKHLLQGICSSRTDLLRIQAIYFKLATMREQNKDQMWEQMNLHNDLKGRFYGLDNKKH